MIFHSISFLKDSKRILQVFVTFFLSIFCLIQFNFFLLTQAFYITFFFFVDYPSTPFSHLTNTTQKQKSTQLSFNFNQTSRDLIRSLIDQQQVTNADEAIHIATELLHSKLIFPTAKTDDSSAILTFSKKQYYSISEDIAITATKNQRAMIKIKSQLRNLEELLIEMKEGFSEVDTTRAADMVAINNYVKSQSKYNRTLLYVLATTIISLTIPKLNLINLDLFHLQSYTDPSIGEYIPYTGWFLVICVTFMFCSWYTKNHSKQISMLSRALGVGAAPKMSLTSSSMHTRSKSTFNSETVEGQKLKLAMDLHKKMVKSIGNSDANDMTTVPMYHEFPGKLTDEADCWSESPGNIFKVRGPNYIKDGLKIHSRACAFKLLHVEFFAVDEGVLVENIAGKDCR